MGESSNDNENIKRLSDIYKIFKEIFIKAPPVLQDLYDESIEIDYKEYINDNLDFKKINQNFQDQKYNSITDAIKDIRHVFLNCYKFYGALNDYTKKSLEIEELLELRLSCLDEDFKPQCDIKITLNLLGIEENPSYKFKYPKNVYDSILLRHVAHCRPERLKEYHKLLSSKLTTDENKAHTLDEILSWEKEIFFNDNYRCISSMPELPEIGNFMSIIFKKLHVDMVNQGEIERMFLMPRESMTMSKIMTTLLIPIKNCKEIDKLMPYIIWSAKLSNKVSEWCKVYHMKKRNKVSVMTSLGIHPDYWAAVGDKNPLLEYEYYKLPYFIKVWLVKGLCDYVTNKYKTINNIIINCNERQCTIWKNDLQTEEYFYFNSMPDLRIYYSNIPNDEPNLEFLNLEKIDEEVNDEKASSIIGVPTSFHTNSRVKPNEKCFKLIADSVQGLRSFLGELYTKDCIERSIPESLINAFEDLIVKVEPNEYNMIVLNNNSKIKLFEDWKSYTERSQKDKDTSLFWEEKELKSVTSKSSNDIIFEKRKSKTVLKEGFDSNITFDSDEYISESENEDCNFSDSDDEWGVLNQPKSKAKQPPVQSHTKLDELEKRLKIESKLINHQTTNMLNSSNKMKSPNILIKNHDKLIDDKNNEINLIKTEKVLSIKSEKEENENQTFVIKNNDYKKQRQQYNIIESITIDDENNDFTSKQLVAKKKKCDILKDVDVDIVMIDDDNVNDCNVTNVDNLRTIFYNSGQQIGETNKHDSKSKPKFNSNDNDEVILIEDDEEIVISDDDVEFVSITQKSSNESIKVNNSFNLNNSQISTPRKRKMGITCSTEQQVTASTTIPKLSPNISIIPVNVNVPKGIHVTMVENSQPIIPNHFNAIKRPKLPTNHQRTNLTDVIVKCEVISKPSSNGEVKFYVNLPNGQLHPISDEVMNTYLKEHNNSLSEYLYIPLPVDVAKKHGYIK